MLIKLIERAAMVSLILVLPACSIYSLPGSTPAPVEERPEYSTVPQPPSGEFPDERSSDPGAIAAYGPLLTEAKNATARGDYEHALTLLERAQRIDPDNPEIYLAMAVTHDARGDFSQAQASAERGLLYCSGGDHCDSLRAYVP